MVTAKLEAPRKTNLKVLRAKYSITQKELAEKLDVSPSTISMIESGENAPSLELAYKISSLFGKTIEEVFFNEIKVI